jgi:type III restriction enzyme
LSDEFFKRPILNSPYECPSRHWELDGDGQPTHQIIEKRRKADFITPIPKPRKRSKQETLALGVAEEISTKEQAYEHATIINAIREKVARWRMIPNPKDWRVTPETERLLQHWRHHPFAGQRPFFCQVEAVETAIWLTEVAPSLGKEGAQFLEHLKAANEAANPGLDRLALKLATGAGKTTVMAMLIAWQTINAVRRPGSNRFTRGFLIVAPGITIRDRLRVLLPNDPDSYYQSRELVPADLMPELGRAEIVITNYHAFKLRERMELSAGGRALLKGRGGDELNTLETEGQMIHRVMPSLMGIKNVLVLNDEAHHCYREKPPVEDEEAEKLSREEKAEAEKNNEAARLWISGLEAVKRKLGVARVIDLSATPFFLSGSGYGEGTLFPWTMSDFSLMDAIECGIVKLPRVPVADNIPGTEMPTFRELWKHIGPSMPKAGRSKNASLDPAGLPLKLKNALDALYGHYAKTFALWREAGIEVPPCFIVVCNNTATSKLVYDYVAGFERRTESGKTTLEQGRLPLFRNWDEAGAPLARPNTLLIDSQQLESGDALDKNFREVAGDEIERFRREIVERTGDPRAGDAISEQDLLREVMNTVGKPGRLGESIRCVVSVSMLTEGWDANTVTHVLGVRAFGTQLLCEQVIGRALRRQSYELNAEGLFDVEYADVLGIPFDFTAKPVPAPPQPPRETVQVKAVRPERDALEIRFPRVVGYRREPVGDKLTARFRPESKLVISPETLGPTRTQTAGIVGETANLNLEHKAGARRLSIVYEITKHLLDEHLRDADGVVRYHLFGQAKKVVEAWLDEYVECKGGAHLSLLTYPELASQAASRIFDAITVAQEGRSPLLALVDSYNPVGSTAQVNFTTSKRDRWQTDARRCHVNWAILDSGWEGELCRVLEDHPRVLAYVKNHGLGFEVPYLSATGPRVYVPDFIVRIDDGGEDPLNLVIEVKGYRRQDADDKKRTMETQWVPGVNALGEHGRWDFLELSDLYEMEEGLEEKIAQRLEAHLEARRAPEAAE